MSGDAEYSFIIIFFFYFKANVGLLLLKWSKYHEDDKISIVIV